MNTFKTFLAKVGDDSLYLTLDENVITLLLAEGRKLSAFPRRDLIESSRAKFGAVTDENGNYLTIIGDETLLRVKGEDTLDLTPLSTHQLRSAIEVCLTGENSANTSISSLDGTVSLHINVDHGAYFVEIKTPNVASKFSGMGEKKEIGNWINGRSSLKAGLNNLTCMCIANDDNTVSLRVDRTAEDWQTFKFSTFEVRRLWERALTPKG